jgi:hypothetical protein
MYLESIVTLLCWPVVILVSYFIIRWAVSRYEKKFGDDRNRE